MENPTTIRLFFKENCRLFPKCLLNFFVLKSPTLCLIGGVKKKKKKNYTKPKKKKHVRKKTKLNVLNYYSVDKGKVKKLKKESPESPGCFLAEHSDRLTCGKTGLTFMKN